MSAEFVSRTNGWPEIDFTKSMWEWVGLTREGTIFPTVVNARTEEEAVTFGLQRALLEGKLPAEVFESVRVTESHGPGGEIDGDSA